MPKGHGCYRQRPDFYGIICGGHRQVVNTRRWLLFRSCNNQSWKGTLDIIQSSPCRRGPVVVAIRTPNLELSPAIPYRGQGSALAGDSQFFQPVVQSRATGWQRCLGFLLPRAPQRPCEGGPSVGPSEVEKTPGGGDPRTCPKEALRGRSRVPCPIQMALRCTRMAAQKCHFHFSLPITLVNKHNSLVMPCLIAKSTIPHVGRGLDRQTR